MQRIPACLGMAYTLPVSPIDCRAVPEPAVAYVHSDVPAWFNSMNVSPCGTMLAVSDLYSIQIMTLSSATRLRTLSKFHLPVHGTVHWSSRNTFYTLMPVDAYEGGDVSQFTALYTLRFSLKQIVEVALDGALLRTFGNTISTTLFYVCRSPSDSFVDELYLAKTNDNSLYCLSVGAGAFTIMDYFAPDSDSAYERTNGGWMFLDIGAFTPDGKYFVSVLSANSAVYWQDVRDRRTCVDESHTYFNLREPAAHYDMIWALAIGANGMMYTVGSQQVMVWLPKIPEEPFTDEDGNYRCDSRLAILDADCGGDACVIMGNRLLVHKKDGMRSYDISRFAAMRPPPYVCAQVHYNQELRLQDVAARKALAKT